MSPTILEKNLARRTKKRSFKPNLSVFTSNSSCTIQGLCAVFYQEFNCLHVAHSDPLESKLEGIEAKANAVKIDATIFEF